MAINTTPHIHHVVICANIIVKKDGKFLLIKRSEQKRFAPGYVHPIGWKVDENEDPLVTAIRELQEETGLSVKNIKLEAVITEIAPPPDFKENRQIFHFSWEYDGGMIETCDEWEFVRYTKEELLEQKLFPSVKPIINYLLDEKTGTIFTSYRYTSEESCEQVSFKICER